MSYRERLGRLPDFSMGTRFNPNALIAAGLPIAPIVEHGSWQTGEPDILRWDVSRGVGQTPPNLCPMGQMRASDGSCQPCPVSSALAPPRPGFHYEPIPGDACGNMRLVPNSPSMPSIAPVVPSSMVQGNMQTAARPWQIAAGVLGVGGIVAMIAGKRLLGTAALGGAGYSYYKSLRAQGWSLISK